LPAGWSFFRAERNEYLDILPASQRMSETQWYRGTADAVAQNIDIIDSYDVEYVLILAGDHIYKMDYERMIRQHVDQRRGRHRGLPDVPRMEATAFGVMDVDANDRITAFPRKARRSARHAGRSRPSRWPRWASTCFRGRSCATLLREDMADPLPAMISAPT
jgi:ADP-glucose pyrophosphorylase